MSLLQGPDLLDFCSELIYSGDVIKVTAAWSRDFTLFLFDHRLIICKKVSVTVSIVGEFHKNNSNFDWFFFSPPPSFFLKKKYIKDLLKRNTYSYKSSLNTDTCEVKDIPDGKGTLSEVYCC